MRDKLREPFADLGEQILKNNARPVRVYALTTGATAGASPGAPTPEKRRFGLAPPLAALATVLVVIAGGAWCFLSANRPASVATKAVAGSIVVLPFANLSGDPGQDYLADALTDELTTGVARLRNTFVIARDTAFTYKGKPVDAKAIGKELGVRYVLEGSVQPSSAAVRVNAQLIDAESGTDLWAEQFDTPRADLLQTQDEIVTRLARAMDVQLSEAEAARLKRTPTANPDAEDLALQCQAGVQTGRWAGKEADAGYSLCERALAADPNNARALTWLSAKFLFSVMWGLSADTKADLERADELSSRAVVVDPNYAGAHSLKAGVLSVQGRLDESIAESERALALDPVTVIAVIFLAQDYLFLGQFEKSLESLDQAIRLSPHDPDVYVWHQLKAADYFGLQRYDQAIESARRAISSNPGISPWPHFHLIAALALGGYATEAREALQSYLASVPTGPKTIAAWKSATAPLARAGSPRYAETLDRHYEGLRKAGMPEE